MFETRITEMFGIKYPIIQGAMLWLSHAELVSAVSDAGGLGIIASSTFPTTKELRQEIRKTRSMTGNPFAVNITLLPTVRPVDYEEYINVAIEEGVDIIETSGRSPEPYMKILKDAKVRIMHKVARVIALDLLDALGPYTVAFGAFANHAVLHDGTTVWTVHAQSSVMMIGGSSVSSRLPQPISYSPMFTQHIACARAALASLCLPCRSVEPTTSPRSSRSTTLIVNGFLKRLSVCSINSAFIASP